MNTSIYFSEKDLALKETTLPIVKLTKSKNGETGTATFIFIKPSIFLFKNSSINTITGMYLNLGNKKIVTNDLNILFKNGKPFLIKAILIFKNSQEWFHFLNFMTCYSKETGLFFSEKNSFS
jgi:photosystem II protein|tara:strand:- start:669 stop:1034 length:366 start_codon:yes stop_codon:yes gene_type:complete